MRIKNLFFCAAVVMLIGSFVCIAANAQVCSGASNDNNVYWSGLGHDSRDPMYRNPGGPVTTGNAVRLHFRSCLNDLTSARVRVFNDRTDTETYLEMSKVASDSSYQWWQATIPASALPTIYYYFFVAIDGTATAYYCDDDSLGGWGAATSDFTTAMTRSFAVTVYDPAFATPDWLKNGIIYQVFPDRFRDGDGSNNNPAGSFFYGANQSIVRSNSSDWNQPLCDPRNMSGPCPNKYDENFYGGDLQGVIDKLDYLQALGVTVIYMNPIFESPSNNKYDSSDYGTIDNNLGNLALFQSLASQAETRGMRLILDADIVFTSADSVYFDLYGRYGATGACESQSAANRSWYTFQGSGLCDGQDYLSWYDYFWFPKLNVANSSVRDLIWQGTTPSPTSAVSRYWLQQGASGWRLDFAGDTDPGLANPANNFWEGFRTATRTQKSESCVIGDDWGIVTNWLLGGEWDSAVNYQFQTALLGFWRDQTLNDAGHNSSSPTGPLSPLTPSQIDAKLRNLEERYPAPAFQAMMNILDNHDTNRALFLLDENADLYNQSTFWNPDYNWSDSIARLKGAVLMQMTLPGAPVIYYGDEVGLVGPPVYDGYWEYYPYTRLPYPWLDQSGAPYYTSLQSMINQGEMLSYYTTLTCARNEHPSLRTGDFRTLLTDDTNKVYEYGRVTADYSDAAVVIVNRKSAVQTLAADVSGYLPVGAAFRDALTDTYYTVDGSGVITVPDVPARSGAVLVSTASLTAPPDAPEDLEATDGPAKVDLSWTAAVGADRYFVLRSILPGGGYQQIGNVTTTTFTDSAVTTAMKYYYVVKSENDATLLESAYSEEVSGRTCRSVGWGQLSSPSTLSYTIGVLPTDPVYGKVFIDEITTGAGQGAGVVAQVGFGTGTNYAAWTWTDASYDGDDGGNDKYVGTMMPSTAGTYSYLYRFRESPLCDWVYCDLNGIGNTHPGTLSVSASTDTQSPTIPSNFTITAVTAGYIDLSWSASTDNIGVYCYDIFRSGDGSSPGTFLARVLSPALTYRDASLVEGVSYSYTVQAMDASLNRSGYSAQVSEKVTEVPSIYWASGTGMSWDYAPRASSYAVYRGTKAGLPSLLNASSDSCTRWTGSATSLTLTETPPAGDFYWYLVVGVNSAGPGSAGNATAGARIVNSKGSCE